MSDVLLAWPCLPLVPTLLSFSSRVSDMLGSVGGGLRAWDVERRAVQALDISVAAVVGLRVPALSQLHVRAKQAPGSLCELPLKP